MAHGSISQGNSKRFSVCSLELNPKALRATVLQRNKQFANMCSKLWSMLRSDKWRYL